MRFHQGFTLLELLIVITIIALLASIGYPLYTHHLTKIRRKQAQILLYQIANRLEQFHLLEGNYEDAHLDIKKLTNEVDQYHFQWGHLSAQNFRVSAVPNKNQAKQDQRCGILSLDEKGKRSISGDGTLQDCWGR